MERLAVDPHGFKVVCSSIEFASSDVLEGALRALLVRLFGERTPRFPRVRTSSVSGANIGAACRCVRTSRARVGRPSPKVHPAICAAARRRCDVSRRRTHLPPNRAVGAIRRCVACIDLAMKHAGGSDKRSIIDAALGSVPLLAMDQSYVGLRVISNALRHGNSDQRAFIIDALAPHTLLLAADPRIRRPSGHQIVEQCLQHATPDQREGMLDWLSMLTDAEAVAELLQLGLEDEDAAGESGESASEAAHDVAHEDVDGAYFDYSEDGYDDASGEADEDEEGEGEISFSVSGDETVDDFARRMIDA